MHSGVLARPGGLYGNKQSQYLSGLKQSFLPCVHSVFTTDEPGVLYTLTCVLLQIILDGTICSTQKEGYGEVCPVLTCLLFPRRQHIPQLRQLASYRQGRRGAFPVNCPISRDYRTTSDALVNIVLIIPWLSLLCMTGQTDRHPCWAFHIESECTTGPDLCGPAPQHLQLVHTALSHTPG